MSVQKQITYTKRVQCEGTVTLDDDMLYDLFKSDLSTDDMVVDGTTATITIEIDLEDHLMELVEQGEIENESELDVEYDDIDLSN
jgi:hypothetical protein